MIALILFRLFKLYLYFFVSIPDIDPLAITLDLFSFIILCFTSKDSNCPLIID